MPLSHETFRVGVGKDFLNASGQLQFSVLLYESETGLLSLTSSGWRLIKGKVYSPARKNGKTFASMNFIESPLMQYCIESQLMLLRDKYPNLRFPSESVNVND